MKLEMKQNSYSTFDFDILSSDNHPLMYIPVCVLECEVLHVSVFSGISVEPKIYVFFFFAFVSLRRETNRQQQGLSIHFNFLAQSYAFGSRAYAINLSAGRLGRFSLKRKIVPISPDRFNSESTAIGTIVRKPEFRQFEK